ncbi:MAG: glutathione S-transferase family protein [Deltaproteobacteria bacterium]|nr:glutathione S-transferase family protein [Deltaproteobacteria bacterium]
MITLYQGPPAWGLPNISPFAIKVETFLRMVDLPYKARPVDPRKGPRQKIPWIDDDGVIVADSQLIVDYLSQKYRCDLDQDLSAEQRALGHALRRMLEEGAYFVGLYARWIDPEGWPLIKALLGPLLPRLLAPMILRILRKKITAQAYAQGTGRHPPADIYKLGSADLEAAATLLGDQPYFLGDEPSSVDATAFAFLTSLLWAPFDSPMSRRAADFPQLDRYCHRMWQRYYADRPLPDGAS